GAQVARVRSATTGSLRGSCSLKWAVLLKKYSIWIYFELHAATLSVVANRQAHTHICTHKHRNTALNVKKLKLQ
ncbi:unnamed protein product, partial [Ceratitis capitata]